MPVVNRSQTSATGILSITSEVPFELYNENVRWNPFQVEGNRYDFVCGSQGNFLIKVNNDLVFSWKNEYVPDFDIDTIAFYQQSTDSEIPRKQNVVNGTYVQWEFLYEDLDTNETYLLIKPNTISEDLQITSNEGTWTWGTPFQDWLKLKSDNFDTSKPLYIFIGNVLVAFVEPYEG